MKVTGLNHVNVFSADPKRTVAFYEQLGFKVGSRPQGFPDPGVWLYLDDGAPWLHVNILTQEAFKLLGPGIFGHVGFSVLGSIEEVTGKLTALNAKYDLAAPVPGANRALYFHGPSGEMVEFVFVELPVPLGRRCGSGSTQY